MNIILWLVFGGLAGWIASVVVGVDTQFGIIGNIVVGIIGAFIGGWVAEWGNVSTERRPTTLISFAFAVLGAVILIFILNVLF